ncbi:MAG: hypothetical protein EB069_00005, partial [Actinobacteria bacterium]|nr:hypothetical protein [Actinomycetota bacterium]
GFSRAYMEGLAGDERLAYATSLALLGGNLVKRGVEQTSVKPDDPMWLKTEQILADHHSKFSKALAQHDSLLDSMQANLQAGFIKIGALLLAALIAGIAALAAALQLNKHLSETGLGALKAQLQGLKAQVQQSLHTSGGTGPTSNQSSSGWPEVSERRSFMKTSSSPQAEIERLASIADSKAQSGTDAGTSGLSLAELAARVALSSDSDEFTGVTPPTESDRTSEYDSTSTLLARQTDTLSGTSQVSGAEDEPLADNEDQELVAGNKNFHDSTDPTKPMREENANPSEVSADPSVTESASDFSNSAQDSASSAEASDVKKTSNDS